ncbi:hypothetical protein [Saccharopolyspora pogona]|uniref:hypothetical protein n=1 Tax=Saccharopolyspora pogona TaxID=333966 RepID=UPI0016883E39|nr:hypothetical protein [Saccharopolyspora pogona]
MRGLFGSRSTSPWARRWPHSRDDAERLADATRIAFLGCTGLTIGGSAVVHGVTWRDWLPGLQLPAPLCPTGFTGHGVLGAAAHHAPGHLQAVLRSA